MRTIALVALALISACNKSTPTPATATLTPVSVPVDHPSLNPLPDPDLAGGHIGRMPRRISVAQLKQSLLTVTGRQWSQLDALAASLGQADFALTVSDSTEPNLVFAKFLDDGAKEVCLNAAKDDLTRAPAARVLWPDVPGIGTDFTGLDDATIANNLSTLALRMWGSAFDPQELITWTHTFKTVAARAKAANKPEQAWGAMCVAMLTDPRFITY